MHSSFVSSSGFDDQGSKFDKDGNLEVWWSGEVSANFARKTQCLAEQYSLYTVEGPQGPVPVNGNLTLGENVADNGGIQAAFRAYRAHRARDGKGDQILPGLGAQLSQDQLFFVSFASIWCGGSRPEAVQRQVRTDPHSPKKWRVIGTLRNSPDFAEAFHCPLGSPMNPQHKCKVW